MAKREAVAIVTLSAEAVHDTDVPLRIVGEQVDRELGRIGADPHRGDYVVVAVERGRSGSAARAIAKALKVEVER